MTIELQPNKQRLENAWKALESLTQKESSDSVLASLRFIKNGIIGNPTRKRFYLKQGIAPRLVESLSSYATNPNLIGQVK
jgi:hypothetical protein